MKTVAIMQPYFVPYRGYFRLFEAADLFVVYDCVQFPRRGFVHRNRFPDAAGRPYWLTLPLAKARRETRICDLEFPADAEDKLRYQIRKIPSLKPLLTQNDSPWGRLLFNFTGTPVDYIERLLKACCRELEVPFNTVRSSSLRLPAALKGQERVLAIAQHFEAESYINSPGGRELYSLELFSEAGIELAFLSDYVGDNWSVLNKLLV